MKNRMTRCGVWEFEKNKPHVYTIRWYTRATVDYKMISNNQIGTLFDAHYTHAHFVTTNISNNSRIKSYWNFTSSLFECCKVLHQLRGKTTIYKHVISPILFEHNDFAWLGNKNTEKMYLNNIFLSICARCFILYVILPHT